MAVVGHAYHLGSTRAGERRMGLADARSDGCTGGFPPGGSALHHGPLAEVGIIASAGGGRKSQCAAWRNGRTEEPGGLAELRSHRGYALQGENQGLRDM